MKVESSPRATLIVSIYRDVEALAVILHALQQQSYRKFSVVISEDGEAPEVARFLAGQSLPFPLLHLTQEDRGFRKNRALNRALLAAPDDYLIFIDGDCVPHRHFIEQHCRYAEHGVVNCGRRIELGEVYSAAIRRVPAKLEQLRGNLRYLRQCRTLRRDGTKNVELGLYLPTLQRLIHERDTSIVGCNFSLYREDIVAVNGFDEAYHSPGLGEDSDIELRLRNNGVRMKGVKHSALQYHLFHPRAYTVSEENQRLFAAAKAAAAVRCRAGIDSHGD